MKKEVYNRNITGKNPFLNKIPQEEFSNSMTTIKTKEIVCFRPNNYRRQIEVKIKDNSTIKKIIGAIPKAIPNKHTKIISIKNYYKNITLQYGRSTLTGIYSQPKIGNDKLTYVIERSTRQELERRLYEIRKEIQEDIDTALKQFSKQFKINLPYKKIIWVRYEDYIKGEPFINSIKRDTIIHDTVFKKVYGEGIEFKSTKKGEEPIVHMKNYINNRAIEDIAPEIAAEINNMHNSISKPLKDLNESIQLEIHNKRLHQKILNSMDNTQKTTIDTLRAMKNILNDISTNLKKKPIKKKKKEYIIWG
ncbi:hypothetical protein LCGC14_0374810 [marine sediment metagenome]|uniref:Uncharacterized protein n=1 Tax=marine sediment metagenome TaxID=412755 RepID=A0A0F9VRI6_9ZZZZ